MNSRLPEEPCHTDFRSDCAAAVSLAVDECSAYSIFSPAWAVICFVVLSLCDWCKIRLKKNLGSFYFYLQFNKYFLMTAHGIRLLGASERSQRCYFPDNVWSLLVIGVTCMKSLSNQQYHMCAPIVVRIFGMGINSPNNLTSLCHKVQLTFSAITVPLVITPRIVYSGDDGIFPHSAQGVWAFLKCRPIGLMNLSYLGDFLVNH